MGTLHVRAVYQTSKQDKDTKTETHLELVLADPPNKGLVLQVVHRPPAQHLLRQAGGRHQGPSLLIQAGQHVQECAPGKFEEN